ncbi:glucosamine-6-phosphate deaminase [Flavihumibacter sp. R14]|nr:glucosamine-6-phosphate deaminase [Flavihumibacter soli]
MKIRIHTDYDHMCKAAASFVADHIRKNPSALICFPSGDTPTGVLRYLVDDVREGKLNIKECDFVGLDEWAGLNAGDEGSCRHYMDEQFFQPLGIEADKIHFFDGAAADLEAECSRINQLVKEKNGIDLMMVGLGMNGHVGLNEPGVDFSLYAHLSELADDTKEVAKKYFRKEVPLTYGITLGPRHLLEAKVAVLIASGSKKAVIVARTLEGDVGSEVPASIIQRHENAYVYLDEDAALLLSRKA